MRIIAMRIRRRAIYTDYMTGWASSTATWRLDLRRPGQSRDTIVEGSSACPKPSRTVHRRQPPANAGQGLACVPAQQDPELAPPRMSTTQLNLHAAGSPVCKLLKRRLALGGGAVGKALRHDRPLHLLCSVSSPDRFGARIPSSRSPGSRIDPSIPRVGGPHAGIAVCLELDPNLDSVALAAARP